MRLGLGVISAALVTTALAVTTEVAHAGSIEIAGQAIDIPVHGFTGSLMSNEAAYTQYMVDLGVIASGRNPLDFSDGLNTHLMGHNPGVFSPLADTIHEGARYAITDHNGVRKIFEFTYVGEQRPYMTVNTQSVLDAVYGSPGEVVTLQYCAYGSNIPQIWLGYEVAEEPDPVPELTEVVESTDPEVAAEVDDVTEELVLPQEVLQSEPLDIPAVTDEPVEAEVAEPARPRVMPQPPKLEAEQYPPSPSVDEAKFDFPVKANEYGLGFVLSKVMTAFAVGRQTSRKEGSHD